MNKEDKRFQAACAAMTGLLSNEVIVTGANKHSKESGFSVEEIIVKMAYEAADELLKQEGESDE